MRVNRSNIDITVGWCLLPRGGEHHGRLCDQVGWCAAESIADRVYIKQDKKRADVGAR